MEQNSKENVDITKMEEDLKEGNKDIHVSEEDLDHTSLSLGQYQTKISKYLGNLCNENANKNSVFRGNEETNIDAFLKQMQAERERSKFKLKELTSRYEIPKSLIKLLQIDDSSFRLRIESLRTNLHQVQCELSRDLKQDFQDICNSLPYDPDESESRFRCEDFEKETKLDESEDK